MSHRLITSLLAALAVSVLSTVPFAPPGGAANGRGAESLSPGRSPVGTVDNKVGLPALDLQSTGPSGGRHLDGSLRGATNASRLQITTTSLPKVTVGDAYSAALAASGGTPPYFWKVVGRYPLPPGMRLSRGGRLLGSPTGSGYYPFTVRVVDSSRPTRQVARASLSLGVYEPPPRAAEPVNWSGWDYGGGPYTAVIGTFNVPNLLPSSGTTVTSEWVGIDGASNSSLIQAGVTETYNPATKSVSTYAWWEILPAANTPIQMSVNPGDLCTVVIDKISGALWEIYLDDLTNGQTFDIDQNYSGPGTSEEWVVEAPRNSSGTEDVLGEYTPTVAFTNLRGTGTTTSSTRLIMKQNGIPVSVPSVMGVWGFAVRYGAVAPAPPPNRPLP